MTGACKIKAEYDVCDKSNKSGITQLTEQLIDNFAVSGRNYIGHLLSAIKTCTGLNSELIRGLASFDPHVMFVLPTNVCLRYFTTLYRIFCRCKWVKEEDDQLCFDEYLSFIDNLRVSFPQLVKEPTLPHDIVDFMVPLVSLRERPLLDYVFRLSCLCLTSPNPELPVVSWGTTSSSSLTCRISEAVFPVQSYLDQVPESSDFCTSKDSVGRFLSLRDDMDQISFSSTYDPWVSVDLVGRGAIYSAFMKVYNKLNPSPVVVETVSKEPSESSDTPRALRPPLKVQGRVNYGKISTAEVDSVATKLVASSSKDK